MQRYTLLQHIEIMKICFKNSIEKSSSVKRSISISVVSGTSKIYGSEKKPRAIIEKPLHSQRVTVWCGFWSGGLIGPNFF